MPPVFNGKSRDARETEILPDRGPARPRLRRSLLLMGLSAALLAICTPGRPFPWLAWVAIAPLFLGLRGHAPVRAAGLAGGWGWLVWFSTVWWLHAPLHDIVGLPLTGAVLLIAGGCVLIALPYALAGWLTARWPRRSGGWGAARDAAVFTLAIHWLTPVFQGHPAHTQYPFPVVFQVVELGGAPLLLFLMLWVNGLWAEVLSGWWHTRRLPWQPAVAAVAIVAVVLAYGAVRLRQFEAAMQAAPTTQWFTVGAIQPNIPLPIAPERAPASNALANDFFTALALGQELVLRHPELDALAFPENPAAFVFNADAVRRQALGQLINQSGKPVILNADAVDATPAAEGVPARYNVAVWLDANRNLAGSYAKIKRIPLVEYLPGETALPWLRRWFPRSLRVRAGDGPGVFELRPGIRVIPVICYEGTISAFARSFVRQGGNFIINQVNDSWFLRTPASEVHLAVTLYRTVEYRVPLVRVTNSGMGAHIQADGRIVPGSRTELFAATATAFPLYVPAHRSVYTRLGDSWMLALLPLFLPRFSRAMVVSQDRFAPRFHLRLPGPALYCEPLNDMNTTPIRVAVTGAAGQIGYSLLFRIASGAMFGPNQPVILHLIEIPDEKAMSALQGVCMELDDCAFPLLKGIVPTSSLDEGFKGVNWALLVGAVPRKAGMERKDLLGINGKIFTGQGQAIAKNAASDVRTFVIGNPCNTNALITMSNAKGVPAPNFFAMTMLDENRAKTQLAKKASVDVTAVSNLAIWGNHSATMFPDFFNAKINGRPVPDVISHREWLEKDFIATVQQRGAAIIKARGLSSAASAANAVVDTVRRLTTPTPAGDWFSVAVCSDGSYGVEKGLISSFPMRSDGQKWEIVQGVALNDFSKARIEVTVNELKEERAMVRELLPE